MAALRGKDQKRAERARSLRRALTPAEFALWTRIRARQLGGFKFVRQEPIEQIEQQTTRLDHCCYNRIWSKMQDLGDLARGGEP